MAPEPGQKLTTPGGHAGLFQRFEEFRGDGGRIARRFEDDGVAADQAGARHAQRDGVGKIPRGNHRAHAESDVAQEAALAGQLHDGLRLVEHQGLAGIEFQEIDGFGGVGLRLIVVFAHFEHQPRVKFELAAAQNLRGAEQDACTLFYAGILPRLEGRKRGLHGGLDVLHAGLLVDSDDFGRVRRVDGDNLVLRADVLSANHQVVFAAQLLADEGDGVAHSADVLRLAIIGDRLVDERPYGGQSGGWHG